MSFLSEICLSGLLFTSRSLYINYPEIGNVTQWFKKSISLKSAPNSVAKKIFIRGLDVVWLDGLLDSLIDVFSSRYCKVNEDFLISCV